MKLGRGQIDGRVVREDLTRWGGVRGEAKAAGQRWMCLACSRNTKEANRAEAERATGRRIETRTSTLAFTPSRMRRSLEGSQQRADKS